MLLLPWFFIGLSTPPLLKYCKESKKHSIPYVTPFTLTVPTKILPYNVSYCYKVGVNSSNLSYSSMCNSVTLLWSQTKNSLPAGCVGNCGCSLIQQLQENEFKTQCNIAWVHFPHLQRWHCMLMTLYNCALVCNLCVFRTIYIIYILWYIIIVYYMNINYHC